MIYESAEQIVHDDVFLRLPRFIEGVNVFTKIEGLNPAGSIKLKTAVGLIDEAERTGDLVPGMRVIESSSGNLGVALSVVCAARNYDFTCVTDPNASTMHVRTMRTLGADIVMVDERDANGGFLGNRIKYIHEAISNNPSLIWVNQYSNSANPNVHYQKTAGAILKALDKVDFLFIGAGTTGTLTGCARRFKMASPSTVIVAVDAVGSVTFGHPPAPRYIPGLGTSRCPEIFSPEGIDEFITISEKETVFFCRAIASRYGILVGGSTGTVVAAVHRFADRIPPGSIVVAISPDLGDRYLDMIYSDEWVANHIGAH
ncbi:MAG: 2,3-diaminopropionate biosynthesis protein SbnA [Desulfobacteraceae bacterium]|nr:2,3-diaminopropionate biosynthesis protein SbnA [Desulfobacteraceae bacterium]